MQREEGAPSDSGRVTRPRPCCGCFVAMTLTWWAGSWGWALPRSTVYWRRRRAVEAVPAKRRGPQGGLSDAV